MELHNIQLDIPEGCNIIIGQTHFIKTAEDLYEIWLGYDVVDWTEQDPLERIADRVREVRDDPERMGLGVVVLVNGRRSEAGGCEHQGYEH